MITIGGDLKGVAPLSPGDSARLVQSDRALGLSVQVVLGMVIVIILLSMQKMLFMVIIDYGDEVDRCDHVVEDSEGGFHDDHG